MLESKMSKNDIIEGNCYSAQDSTAKAVQIMGEFMEEFEAVKNAPSVKSMTPVPTFNPGCNNPESEANRTLSWVASYRSIMTHMQIVFDYLIMANDDLKEATEAATEAAIEGTSDTALYFQYLVKLDELVEAAGIDAAIEKVKNAQQAQDYKLTAHATAAILDMLIGNKAKGKDSITLCDSLDVGERIRA